MLRRPVAADTEAIFERYASDPDVTRYLSWPRHRSVDDTRAFLALSDAEWQRWPAGPYLLTDKGTGTLLGGTGFAFETANQAATGYVLARDAWGRGLATEALAAMVGLAPSLGLRRLYAVCHRDHRASQRVLEKCGFQQEDVRRQDVFPNLAPGVPVDVVLYARELA